LPVKPLVLKVDAFNQLVLQDIKKSFHICGSFFYTPPPPSVSSAEDLTKFMLQSLSPPLIMYFNPKHEAHINILNSSYYSTPSKRSTRTAQHRADKEYADNVGRI